jgi:hypothetical protein
MNTIDFDQNRNFCEYLAALLASQEFKTFACLLSDNGMTLTDYIDQTIDALMPPPDLTGYFAAIQKYIGTGEMT